MYHEIMKEKWYEKAKKIMRDKNITQEELISLFGVTTRGAVGHYLNGRREPSGEQLKALATKLNISLDCLFSEQQSNNHLSLNNFKGDIAVNSINEKPESYEKEATNEDKALVDMIKQLTPEQKNAQKAAIQATVESNQRIFNQLLKQKNGNQD